MKRLFSLYINKVYAHSVFSIVLCLPLFLLTACGVHELPEDGGVDPTVVHTTIVLLPGADMTPFDIPEFSTRAADGHTINRKTFCDAFPNHFVSILHLLTQNELRFFIYFPESFKQLSKGV